MYIQLPVLLSASGKEREVPLEHTVCKSKSKEREVPAMDDTSVCNHSHFLWTPPYMYYLPILIVKVTVVPKINY